MARRPRWTGGPLRDQARGPGGRGPGESEGIEPVVVTFLSDANTLAGLLARTGALGPAHAYQPPGVVAGDQGRRAGCSRGEGPPPPGRHLHRERFVGAYERAGTDCFLLDAATEDGQVGTGQRLDSQAVARLADRLTRPFLLAGGIADEFQSDDKVVVEHPLFLGVDVDSGARGADGRFDPGRVAAIRACWRAPVDAGPVDDGFVDAENVA